MKKPRKFIFVLVPLLIIIIGIFSYYLTQKNQEKTTSQEQLENKETSSQIVSSSIEQQNTETKEESTALYDKKVLVNTAFLVQEQQIEDISKNFLNQMYDLDSHNIREITQQDYEAWITPDGWDNMQDYLVPFQEPDSNTVSVTMLDNCIVYPKLTSENTATALCITRIITENTLPQQDTIQSVDIHMVTLHLQLIDDTWLIDNINAIQTITNSVYDTNSLFS